MNKQAKDTNNKTVKNIDASDVVMIINSCDAYSDLWDPFFKLLKKYWNPQYPIILNTETKRYGYPGLNIKTLQLYKENEKPEWSERLMKTLRHIDSEYVILMLDDFFLEKPVDEEKIIQTIAWMKEDSSIASFCFVPVLPDGYLPSVFPGFGKRPAKGEYRLTCQASVWRRETLLNDMRPHESAWLFETLGSKRSWRYKDQKFFAAEPDNIIMEYDDKIGGAVHRGKWNNYMKELNDLEDLHIDFTRRGFNDLVPGSSHAKKVFLKSRLNSKGIVRAVSNRWRSLKW